MSQITTLIKEWKETDRVIDENPLMNKHLREIEVELARMGYCPQKLASVRPVSKDEYVSQYSKQQKENRKIGERFNSQA